jgi:hypothetical protein
MAMKDEVLGLRKVVFREGHEIRTMKGDVTLQPQIGFVKVRTFVGDLLIDRSSVIAIKEVRNG